MPLMTAAGSPLYDARRSASWLVCSAYGTQFPTPDREDVTSCLICDDPRQYTPHTGQAFTTLAHLRAGHRNVWTVLPGDHDFTSIVTAPKFAIGQRAILIKDSRNVHRLPCSQTPVGNALWDCITLLDGETVDRIRALGGLRAIVVSHPHYYTTHVEWARTFNCPVYLAAEDKERLVQSSPLQVFVSQAEFDLPIAGTPSGVTVLKLGGHFSGSLVTLYNGRLLIADTLLTTPAGLGNWQADALGSARNRPRGMNSYSFMWSIPNFIPLAPAELERMWGLLKTKTFRSTHRALLNTDIMKEEAEMKRQVLESMQIQIRRMGHGGHPLLSEASA